MAHALMSEPLSAIDYYDDRGKHYANRCYIRPIPATADSREEPCPPLAQGQATRPT
jgi:hypothetical protein